MCHTHMSSEASIGSWTNFRKSPQVNWQFSQEAWLKPYLDMNTKLRAKAKNNFEIKFFKDMTNWVCVKTLRRSWGRIDINFMANDRKKNWLLGEPDYHAVKWFSNNLL